MNVVLNTREVLEQYPNLDYKEWLNRRSKFYRLEVEKTVNFKPSELKALYIKKFQLFGDIKYINIILRRNSTIGFLTLAIKKN